MKYKIILLLLLFTNVALAQEKTYYCEVLCECRSVDSRPKVYIDFGDMKDVGDAIRKSSKLEPVDSQGKVIKFSTRMEILNWMTDNGWTLVSQNVVSNNDSFRGTSSEGYIVVYLMSKVGTKTSVKEGIVLKSDLEK